MPTINKRATARCAGARAVPLRGAGLFVVIDFGGRCGDRIPKGSNPTCLHTSRAAAKAEANRLSAANTKTTHAEESL